MIISRTPYRVSFFGGGTDYPAWYSENGGAVLASSINRYCYLTCRFLPPFFEHRSRVVWSKIQTVGNNSEIEHPAVRATLKLLGMDQGIDIHHHGDLPARTGLGSSSAFSVGLLNALHALSGRRVSATDLAKQAVHVEQVLLEETVGVQDQIQTAHGGLNRIDIQTRGHFSVSPLLISSDRELELQSHLMLFFTGVSRTAHKIARAQVEAFEDKKPELTRIREMVDEGQDILTSNSDITDFGRLLDDSWKLKQTLAKQISPTFVKDIYARARAAGAIGGKLLGAGGGGFMLLFVQPDHQIQVANALSELLLVPIEFDHTGSQILVYEPDQYTRTVMAGERFKTYQLGNDIS